MNRDLAQCLAHSTYPERVVASLPAGGARQMPGRCQAARSTWRHSHTVGRVGMPPAAWARAAGHGREARPATLVGVRHVGRATSFGGRTQVCVPGPHPLPSGPWKPAASLVLAARPGTWLSWLTQGLTHQSPGHTKHLLHTLSFQNLSCSWLCRIPATVEDS